MRTWLIIAAALMLAGCRGQISEQPPIHLVRNMMFQPKYTAQVGQPAFQDGEERADSQGEREPVAGTVPIEGFTLDLALTKGMKPDGKQYVWTNPMPITKALLERGQNRFNIYCAPCHDKSGSGNGAVIQRQSAGFPPPTKYTDERVLNMPDGEIFTVISNGVRTMPAYRYQVPVEDRWAIVAYVRALQRSQHTTMADVPADLRGKLSQ